MDRLNPHNSHKKHMHSLVAQMALSANFRQNRNLLSGITIAEVEEAIAKEDINLKRMDTELDKLFASRGSNPISMDQVSEEYAA